MKKSSLQKRYNKSFETKDSGGGGSVFAFPSETKFFKPKEARNEIILVPYKIKTKKHPMVASGDMEIGDEDYVMDVWVHRSVGPGEVDVVCLKNNYHKACPCCEQAKEFRDAGDEKSFKALKASRRVYYNVLNARKMDAGVQVFATSHYLFEKELIDEASSDSDGKGVNVDFASVEDGKVISFRGAMTNIGKTEFMEFKSISFADRDKDQEITDEDLASAVSFDEVMKVLTPDEIKKVLYSGAASDDEDEDGASTRSSRRNRDKDEDEDEDDKGRGKGRRDNDDEEESSSRSSRRNRDKDDEGDDEEEQSSRSRRNRDKDESNKPKEEPKENTCPEGYNYPDDWDQKKGCEKCKIWDRCNDAFDELKKGKN